jgi:hypothetical protein
MTEEQLDNLRHLIKQEIDAATLMAWNTVSGDGCRRRMANLKTVLNPPKFYTLRGSTMTEEQPAALVLFASPHQAGATKQPTFLMAWNRHALEDGQTNN